MAEFRPIADDEVVRHQEVMDHAFDEEPGPPAYAGPEDVEESLAERWGLFDDGILRSACLLYDLDVTLAGGPTAIGGIGGFATPPEHRGAGHGVTLQREALAVFRERGYPFAVLWAISIPYYRRTGWELLHLQTEYEFPPAAIDGIGPGSGAGTVARVDPADIDRIAPVYDAFRDGYALALDRSDAWWRTRVLDDVWVFAFTPTDGDVPTGYVVYQLPHDEDGATLEVRELVARTETARRALFDFLDRHAPQVERVRLYAPEETRLLHEVPDPGDVTATVTPGAMGRIVDVASAVDALPAYRTPHEPVTIAVSDPLGSLEGETVRIATNDDGPTCSSVDGTGSPDVRLDVGTLSKLYAGTVEATALANRGVIDVDPTTLDALATLFPAEPVYLTDFF